MNNRLPSPTTLRDIALAAGVSAPTVSRVLRGRPETRVSAKTKEKIFALAKEMNYHPNMLARSLKTQSTNILAFFLPNIASPVFPEVIRGAEKAASDNRFTLFLTELDKNALTSKRYLALLKDRIIDGLILAIAGEADVVINDLVEANAHFVLVNRMVSFSSNYVTVDDAAGVYIATAHLLDLGHKAVGYISGPLILDTACRRL
jgi:LacI family transcriptional regulator